MNILSTADKAMGKNVKPSNFQTMSGHRFASNFNIFYDINVMQKLAYLGCWLE
jgi:hypothetical protein